MKLQSLQKNVRIPVAVHQYTRSTVGKTTKLIRKYPIILAGIVVLFCFTTAAFIEKSFLELRIQQSTQETDNLVEKARIERQKSYIDVVEKQRQQNQVDTSDQKDITTSKVRNLSGKYNIHVLFVAESQETIDASKNLISTLTSKNANAYSSLSYVPTYFLTYAQEYRHDPFELNILTYEKKPLILSPTMVGDIKQIWGKDPFGIAKLQEDFEKKAQETIVILGKKDLVVFLYLDPNLTYTDPTNFYENKRFRSFANDKLGRVYIDVYDITADFAPTVNEIVIHELLHQFGANDFYDEYSYSCHKKGLGEPNQEPLYPQKTADIMCGRIAESEKEYRNASFEKGELVINEHTAKNIGWTKE